MYERIGRDFLKIPSLRMRRLRQEERATLKTHPDIRTPRGVHSNTIPRGRRRVAKTWTCHCLVFSHCACSGYNIKRTKATEREQKSPQLLAVQTDVTELQGKEGLYAPMKMGALIGTICWWHILLLPFPGGRGPALPLSPRTLQWCLNRKRDLLQASPPKPAGLELATKQRWKKPTNDWG